VTFQRAAQLPVENEYCVFAMQIRQVAEAVLLELLDLFASR
jgi:hypothetical protein